MEFIKSLVLSTLLVFVPIHAALITVLVLVTCDLILGILAARKRGEHITSSGFRRSIVKLFIYEIAIALGFLCETYLTGAMVPLAKIIGGFIGITEIKSCLENLSELSGTNLLQVLINKLSSTEIPKE